MKDCAPCLRLSASLEGKPDQMVEFCREQRLEGIVAKKRDSVYRPGERCTSWMKFKTRQEATFLVGGFLPSVDGFSSVAVGFKRDGEFRYAGKLEVYLPRSAKAEVLRRLVPLAASAPEFVGVPSKRGGDTWSVGITADELSRFPNRKGSASSADNGFGRHATDIETIAAQQVFLDDCNPGTQAGCACGRNEPRRAAPNDDEVVARCRRGVLPACWMHI